MTISKHDAAAALSEIESATTRACELTWYERGGPYLILWGVIWMVASGLTHVVEDRNRLIWSVANLIGLVVNLWMVYATERSKTEDSAARRHRTILTDRVFATMLTANAFAWASFWILRPGTMTQILAFIGMLAAAVYLTIGIWFGLRYVGAGLVVGAAMIAGYVAYPESFRLWFAVFGGGSLIVCGLWLRRA